MAKFKVGDKARFILPGDESHNQECTIIAIGHISMYGQVGDYEIKFTNSAHDHPVKVTWGVLEDQLEPITDLGSWQEIEESIGWNPTKQMEGVK